MNHKVGKIVCSVFLAVMILISFGIIIYLSLDVFRDKEMMSERVEKEQQENTKQNDEKEKNTEKVKKESTEEKIEKEDIKEVTETTTATIEATTEATTKVRTETTTQVTTQVETETTVETTTAVNYNIYEPNWQVYHDPEYNFSIQYPGNFIAYNSYNVDQRYTAQAPDGTAELKIFSMAEVGTPKEGLENILETMGGHSDFNKVEEDHYIVSILKDGMCYYRYAKYGVGKGITGFEMYYVEDMHEYDEYIEHMYASMQ